MANKEKIKNKESSVKRQLSVGNLFNSIIGNKFTGLYLSVIYFVAMLVISFAFHKIGDYGIETDFYQSYVPAAKEFLNGVIKIDQFRGPLYQIVLGITGFIFSDFFKAGVFINVLSSSVVIYFTFKIIKEIYSAKIAFFATLLMIFNPIFVQYTYSAGTDLFFAALLSVSFYFFFKDKAVSIFNLVLAGVLGGLAYLTRYNGVFILGFVVVILFINYFELSWRKRFTYSAIFVLIFFVTISPWGIYTLIEKGSFFYNENYKNIAFELFGKGKIQWDQFWYGSSTQYTSLTDVILKDPYLFLTNSVKNIYTHFTADMSRLLGWYVGVFVILGMVIAFLNNPIKNWKNRQSGYILMNVFFFIILLLVFYSERFSLFLIPFYLTIALNGFWNDNKSLSKIVSQKLVLLIMLFLVCFSFISTYNFNRRRINSGPVEVLSFKKWYDENITAENRGKIIAARKPQIAYYLNMQFNMIPLAQNYQQLIDALRKDKDDYLYFSLIEAQFRPQLQFLLNPNNNYPGLKPIVYIQNPPAILYKVE